MAQAEKARLHEGRLIVATHNAGKLREFRTLLEPFSVELASAGELKLPEPEETGTTFAENAALKALAAAKATGIAALSDDSGLAVWALHGAPGLFSARWAGSSGDFRPAMARVEAELQARGATTPETRGARFVAALVLAWPDGHIETVEGFVDGTIVWPPRGEHGFGYDPIFKPDGETRTYGEMLPSEKHTVDWTARRGVSHRARAFVNLAERCLVRR